MQEHAKRVPSYCMAVSHVSYQDGVVTCVTCTLQDLQTANLQIFDSHVPPKAEIQWEAACCVLW